eukprot:1158745-Pelagomonas_calceolata.AAC.1
MLKETRCYATAIGDNSAARTCKIRKMSLSSRWVKGTVEFMDTPPPLRFLKVTLGGGLNRGRFEILSPSGWEDKSLQ